MRYLRSEDILVIHAEIVNAIGGLHGVRDTTLLASIADKPRGTFDGKELYVDVYTKAAVYLEAIANYHVFVDGNKRTAFAVAARCISCAGMHVYASQDEVVHLMLRVATKDMGVEDIAVWLKEHTN